VRELFKKEMAGVMFPPYGGLLGFLFYFTQAAVLMKSVPPRGSGWIRFAVAHLTIFSCAGKPTRYRVVVLTSWTAG
jgi:hypothetical protein